jgi:hypothetical protein
MAIAAAHLLGAAAGPTTAPGRGDGREQQPLADTTPVARARLGHESGGRG